MSGSVRRLHCSRGKVDTGARLTPGKASWRHRKNASTNDMSSGVICRETLRGEWQCAVRVLDCTAVLSTQLLLIAPTDRLHRNTR